LRYVIREPAQGPTGGWAPLVVGSAQNTIPADPFARNVVRVIDVRVMRENPEALRVSQIARGEDPALVDQLLAADDVRRASIMASDTVRTE
jgi:hypothetical protein